MRLLVSAALAWAGLVPAFAADAPPWADQVVGLYIGRDHNVGELQCEQIEFSLRDGSLVARYRIEDDPPFEGELTYLGAEGDTGGRFLWSDRDGSGIRVIHFARDFATFWSAWGIVAPDARLTGYGLRGADAVVPGCSGGPTS